MFGELLRSLYELKSWPITSLHDVDALGPGRGACSSKPKESNTNRCSEPNRVWFEHRLDTRFDVFLSKKISDN